MAVMAALVFNTLPIYQSEVVMIMNSLLHQRWVRTIYKIIKHLPVYMALTIIIQLKSADSLLLLSIFTTMLLSIKLEHQFFCVNCPVNKTFNYYNNIAINTGLKVDYDVQEVNGSANSAMAISVGHENVDVNIKL
jgi:hypothetical protein